MTSLEDVAKGSVAAESALEPPDAITGEDFICFALHVTVHCMPAGHAKISMYFFESIHCLQHLTKASADAIGNRTPVLQELVDSRSKNVCRQASCPSFCMHIVRSVSADLSTNESSLQFYRHNYISRCEGLHAQRERLHA